MNIENIFINNAKKSEKSIIVSSVLTFVIGIMLAIYPNDSLSILTKIIAIGLMLVGVYELISFFKETKENRIGSASFALGVIIFFIGLYVFINDGTITKFITKMIGIVVCIKSIYKIQLAISIRSYSKSWKYILVSGMIVLSLGIIMVFKSSEAADLITRIIGICLALSSVYEIAESLMFIKKIDKIADAVFVEKEKE